MDKQKINEMACKFEEKFGPENLIKVSFSSLTKLLIEKGILTEEEILHQFTKEVEIRLEELKTKRQKRHSQ